jgi:hypothetical protein
VRNFVVETDGSFVVVETDGSQADPTQFPLPELGLFDARAVLAAAKLEHFGAGAEAEE